MDCLQGFVESATHPSALGTPSTRFGELLLLLPQIQSAAELLLNSKMFYVPFLLNSLNLPEEEAMDQSMHTDDVDAPRIPFPQQRQLQSQRQIQQQMQPLRASTREEIEAARDAVMRTIQEESVETVAHVERQRHQSLAPNLVSEDVANAVEVKPEKSENKETVGKGEAGTGSAMNVEASPLNMTAYAMKMKSRQMGEPSSSNINEPAASSAGFASHSYPQLGNNKLRQLLEAPKESTSRSGDPLGVVPFNNVVNAAFR